MTALCNDSSEMKYVYQMWQIRETENQWNETQLFFVSETNNYLSKEKIIRLKKHETKM